MLLLILSLVLHVHAGGSVGAALDSARAVYTQRGETTTILIEPGTYQEELTIDVPGIRLVNASKHPSIALRDGGVHCDANAVRLTWYYGHGYQYRSMGSRINYGGSRERRWNASVLVTAPDFYAENIIFENSFNLYISDKEAADDPDPFQFSLFNSQFTKEMPVRPKTAGSTEVQRKSYRERAAAISFTETAVHAHLKNCRAVGRQDVLYGDEGASVYWQGGVLQGGVDFIFGGLTLAVDRAVIVANINGETGDKCYICAGRSEGRGMLFYKCHIRLATEDELDLSYSEAVFQRSGSTGEAGLTATRSDSNAVFLARPWRWWGETVWAYTTWDKDILDPVAWNTGLVEKKPGFNPDKPCPNSYEYRSQDRSKGRPQWVTVLTKPTLPDGTRLTPKAWLK